MGHETIYNEDSNTFDVWSTVVDAFLAKNLTREQAIDFHNKESEEWCKIRVKPPTGRKETLRVREMDENRKWVDRSFEYDPGDSRDCLFYHPPPGIGLSKGRVKFNERCEDKFDAKYLITEEKCLEITRKRNIEVVDEAYGSSAGRKRFVRDLRCAWCGTKDGEIHSFSERCPKDPMYQE